MNIRHRYKECGRGAEVPTAEVLISLIGTMSLPIIQSSFPKIDHSANFTRIILVDYSIGSVVELNFCQRFGKDFTRFW